MGTGHDCAAIARQRYATKRTRQQLVQNLLLQQEHEVMFTKDEDNGTDDENTHTKTNPNDGVVRTNEPVPTDFGNNFEEVKLVLGLLWQKSRWDGSDGGPGGYRDVLRSMIQARRYEPPQPEWESARYLLQDVQERFHRLQPTPEQQSIMDELVATETNVTNYDHKRRVCSGLVLQAMGFIDKGL